MVSLLRTIVVAGIHYLIHPQKLGTITATINPDSIIPVTLLTTEEIFGGDLEQVLKRLDEVDDVFVPEFGGVLIEKFAGNGTIKAHMAELSHELYHMDTSATTLAEITDLPSGPYILYGPNVYQAWRLYDDEYDAFTYGVIPEDVNAPEVFAPLNALSPNGFFKSIPVPSRLYHRKPTAKKPLSGIRVSISDALQLNGVQTTLSSRAWAALYPYAEQSNADYAQKLIDLGAVIVGKTKIAQFAAGEEWVDVKAPWNPRADGYQSIKGSSAGAGSAVAGYDWLQHAFGEDAIGGMRDPTAYNGVYSLRPTFSNASLWGMQLSSPRYDTVSLAGRTLNDLQSTAKVFYAPSAQEAPKKIVYLDDLLDLSKEQSTLVDGFVKTLEDFLKTKAQRTGLSKLWTDSLPKDANGLSLEEYMKDAPYRSFCYDYAREYSYFRDNYRGRFDQEPFVEATTKFRWDYGKKVTEDQYNGDLVRLQVFKTWFDEKVVGSDAVVVLPFGLAEPTYRQDTPEAPKTIEGITPSLLAPVLGAPHLIIPFSKLPYDSKVTKRQEQLPVSASLLGGRGSDVALIQLVQDAFKAAKWPTEVPAGR